MKKLIVVDCVTWLTGVYKVMLELVDCEFW